VTLVAGPLDTGKRLDTFLHEKLPEFSRSRLQSWIKASLVSVDGKAATRASVLIKGGETISVIPAGLPPLRAQPEELPLKILYEDPEVIVVDKPAGMVVHAGAGHHQGTLVNALLHHFGTLSSINGDLRPGIVHRLDKETSGVLAVARTDFAHQALAAQFQNRQVEKVYLALVHGRVKGESGTITTPITRDPIRRTRMTTKLGSGRSAFTEYQVIEQFPAAAFLRVRIGTGRTHQIRVHLASIGHPIVGDRLYGAPPHLPGLPTLARFFLHAHRLRLVSPGTGVPITVESPLSQDLANVLACLRGGHIE
jgi:23S rRNA pseudouridine1911/1915/1917 synthase